MTDGGYQEYAASGGHRKCPYCGKRLKHQPGLLGIGRMPVCRGCGRTMPWVERRERLAAAAVHVRDGPEGDGIPVDDQRMAAWVARDKELRTYLKSLPDAERRDALRRYRGAMRLRREADDSTPFYNYDPFMDAFPPGGEGGPDGGQWMVK